MSADVLPADQDEIYAEQAPAPGQKRCLNERESFVLGQFLTLSIQWHHIQASIWVSLHLGMLASLTGGTGLERQRV